MALEKIVKNDLKPKQVITLWVFPRMKAQWLNGNVSRFRTTSPGSIPGLGKADSAFHPCLVTHLSTDKGVPSLLKELNTGDLASD
ncbi:hypothetical protein TNCV_4820781 [Trichonephila clavipes]|nr:hypothetical protein TNCV_4820781 [Trichonephila clavipes]